MRAALIALAALAASCAPAKQTAVADYHDCAGYQPAMGVMDAFLEAFNKKDMEALEKTFHFPHMRIASFPLVVWTGPGQQDDVFGRLGEEDWDHSAWADRKVIQCSATKAHVTATFVRFNKAGKEYSRFEGLYIIEQRDGFWGVTIRSSFAP